MRSNDGKTFKVVRLERHYLPAELKITSWEDVRPWFDELESRPVDDMEALERWLADRSELAFVLEEDLAWRYIRMNCHTDRKEYAEAFNTFVKEIEPGISRRSDRLDSRLLDHPLAAQLDGSRDYGIMMRVIRNRKRLFREENVPIQAELQVLEQDYGRLVSQMTVTMEGKEMTLQQASNYLREPHRDLRKEAFLKIRERRYADAGSLHDLFDKLIEKRTRIAKNAAFADYRDYRFAELGRFDYTVADCETFHESIRTTVMPLVEELHRRRLQQTGGDVLRPWDLEHDPQGRPPLRPFSDVKELTEKASRAFDRIDPRFGELLRTMDREGYLDLDSRKNKAPGGFNYPLYESNLPFIYMNATGNLRDLETIFHEGGHAIHSWLSSHIRIIEHKELPSEVAELASMSMELISMDTWDIFFTEEELQRARREQLEGIIRILPWIAAIDKFQHWIYTHPGHTHGERDAQWTAIMREFSSPLVDWSGYEHFLATGWQGQLHLFEVPFYYIEYGISQLGALAVWKNYRENREKGLSHYERALSLGYSRPIPEIYDTAGIRFDFSEGYVKELMQFVAGELEL